MPYVGCFGGTGTSPCVLKAGSSELVEFGFFVQAPWLVSEYEASKKFIKGPIKLTSNVEMISAAERQGVLWD